MASSAGQDLQKEMLRLIVEHPTLYPAQLMQRWLSESGPGPKPSLTDLRREAEFVVKQLKPYAKGPPGPGRLITAAESLKAANPGLFDTGNDVGPIRNPRMPRTQAPPSALRSRVDQARMNRDQRRDFRGEDPAIAVQTHNPNILSKGDLTKTTQSADAPDREASSLSTEAGERQPDTVLQSHEIEEERPASGSEVNLGTELATEDTKGERDTLDNPSNAAQVLGKKPATRRGTAANAIRPASGPEVNPGTEVETGDTNGEMGSQVGDTVDNSRNEPKGLVKKATTRRGAAANATSQARASRSKK
ncbi:hypothetical protein FRC00_003180 [Tulasnella sp. 408]|nr:hypothetical protein FRC00_003180 [Tulasnella sp. 408]